MVHVLLSKVKNVGGSYIGLALFPVIRWIHVIQTIVIYSQTVSLFTQIYTQLCYIPIAERLIKKDGSLLHRAGDQRGGLRHLLRHHPTGAEGGKVQEQQGKGSQVRQGDGGGHAAVAGAEEKEEAGEERGGGSLPGQEARRPGQAGGELQRREGRREEDQDQVQAER